MEYHSSEREVALGFRVASHFFALYAIPGVADRMQYSAADSLTATLRYIFAGRFVFYFRFPFQHQEENLP
jgi:hypothetical protein